MAGFIGNIVGAKAITGALNLPVVPIAVGLAAATATAVFPEVAQAIEPIAKSVGLGPSTAAGLGAAGAWIAKDFAKKGGNNSGAPSADGTRATEKLTDAEILAAKEEIDKNKEIEGEGRQQNAPRALGEDAALAVAATEDNRDTNRISEIANSRNAEKAEDGLTTTSRNGKNSLATTTEATVGAVIAARETDSVKIAEGRGADPTGKDPIQHEIKDGQNPSAVEHQELTAAVQKQGEEAQAGQMLVSNDAAAQARATDTATNQEVSGSSLNNNTILADHTQVDVQGQGHTKNDRLDAALQNSDAQAALKNLDGKAQLMPSDGYGTSVSGNSSTMGIAAATPEGGGPGGGGPGGGSFS